MCVCVCVWAFCSKYLTLFSNGVRRKKDGFVEVVKRRSRIRND